MRQARGETLRDCTEKADEWTRYKQENERVAEIYLTNPAHRGKGERMRTCANNLAFEPKSNPMTGEINYTLISARYCNVRYCPICQWARRRKDIAKSYQALPSILEKHPSVAFMK